VEPKSISQSFVKKDDKKSCIKFDNSSSDQLLKDAYVMRDAFKKLFGVDLANVTKLTITVAID